MASEHCLLFNFPAGCKQREGGTVGFSVSISSVFIFWNTFKVYILRLQVLQLSVLASVPATLRGLSVLTAVGRRLSCHHPVGGRILCAKKPSITTSISVSHPSRISFIPAKWKGQNVVGWTE